MSGLGATDVGLSMPSRGRLSNATATNNMIREVILSGEGYDTNMAYRVHDEVFKDTIVEADGNAALAV